MRERSITTTLELAWILGRTPEGMLALNKLTEKYERICPICWEKKDVERWYCSGECRIRQGRIDEHNVV